MLRFLAVLASSLLLTSAFSAEPGSSTEQIERQSSYDPRGAVIVANAAITQARLADDARAELHALRLLVRAEMLLDESDGAMGHLNDALALADTLKDAGALSELLVSKAVMLSNEQRVTEALSFFDRAEQVATEHGLQRELIAARTERGSFYSWNGRTAEALALLNQCYVAAETLGDRMLESTVLSAIGDAQSSPRAAASEKQKGAEHFRAALQLIDRSIYRVEAESLMHNLGVALYRQGEYGEARRQFEQALPLAEALQDALGIAYIDYRLAMVALHENNLVDAARHLERARPVLNSAGPQIMRFKERLASAELLSRRGRRADSLKALREAQQLRLVATDAARDASYYETAAQVHARFGDMELAFRMMERLREAERLDAITANDSLAAELRTRFDVQRQAHDNALLRARASEADAKRWLLLLALGSISLLLSGLMLMLGLQIRQKRRYADLALRDELTCLPNRRSMLDHLRHQLNGRRASDDTLHVAVLDLDHFKQINDQHGHDVGDAVLRAFAMACKPLLRETDHLGRFGGEEFLLILPRADSASVHAVFERMQQAVRDITVPGTSFAAPLSFSMGAAAAHADDEMHALLKRADQALYVAKDAGRDRCVVVDANASDCFGRGPHLVGQRGPQRQPFKWSA